MKAKIEHIAKLDFTSDRKAMSTLVSGYTNGKDLLLKGAPDRVLNKCTSYMHLGGKAAMGPRERDTFMKNIEALASEGLRCLAIAEVPNGGALSAVTKDNKQSVLGDISKYDQFESDAVLVGIVAIKDPVREQVKPAIADCQTAGIRVIMITGDSRETAASIAKEVGILSARDDLKQSVFTGAEFQAMSPAER